MSVLVCTDFGIWKCNDKFYTKFAFSSIIKRYKESFGELSLCCPIRYADKPPEDFIDITDIVTNIVHCDKYMAIMSKRNVALNSLIEGSDLVLCRLAGFVPMYASKLAKKIGTPVFSEVMSCGWDGFWNHSILGKIVAPYIFFGARKTLRNSDYALYVTEQFLQKRYPCNKPSVGVSDVVIPNIKDEIYDTRFKKIESMDKNNITLMTCAAVNVWYKGQHFVIRSIPILNKMGIKVKYYCVGQGSQNYLKKIAKKCKVEDQVIFTGSVTHDRIFELLDECDIYIQPSLQEGLPRALVEAMSRGCPAVGARTGGIPELLPQECVVRRKSVTDIAKTIRVLLDGNLKQYSNKSLSRAKDFQKEVLDERRNTYFEYVKRNEKIE